MTTFVKASYRVALAGIALAAVPSSSALAAPLISNGVYEEFVDRNCINVGACEVKFSRVPVGKTLHLVHMSCRATFQNAAQALSTVLHGTPRWTFVAPVTLPDVPGSSARITVANAEVLKLYPEGSRPTISMGLSSPVGMFAQCQIAGQLKP